MNKIYWILTTLLLVFFGCSESELIPVEPGTEVQERMRIYFSNELKCTTPGAMQTNLYQGIYKGTTVYFVALMCPNCNTVPPKKGYTDKLEEVVFSDFQDVTDMKMIYDSCTRKYSE